MVGWNMILVYLNLGLVLALPKKETKRNYQNGEQSNHHEHQCNPENINQAFIHSYLVCMRSFRPILSHFRPWLDPSDN